jgi:hypothetical protein
MSVATYYWAEFAPFFLRPTLKKGGKGEENHSTTPSSLRFCSEMSRNTHALSLPANAQLTHPRYAARDVNIGGAFLFLGRHSEKEKRG